jgi:hypothetical protein
MCSIMMIVMPCALQPEEDGQDVVHLGAGQPGHGLVGDEQLRPRGPWLGPAPSLRISICVSPAGRRCAFASSPMVRKISPALGATLGARASRPAYSSGMPRFSSTVMLVKGLGIWKVRTMPSRVRWCGGNAVISRAVEADRAAIDRQHAETQLMSVVLPDPFGPMRPKRSPALTDRGDAVERP